MSVYSSGTGGPSPTSASPESSHAAPPGGAVPTMASLLDVAGHSSAAIADARDLRVEVRWTEVVELNADGTPGRVVSRADAPATLRAVEFTGVDARHAFRALLACRNTGRVAQRIRVSPPSTRAFSASYDVGGPIAPGMDLPVLVTFRVPEAAASGADQFTDVLPVRAESGSVASVPLRAFAPLPRLEFDSFISFGPVVLGSVVTRTFDIVNASSERGASVGISVKGVGSGGATTGPFAVFPTRALLAPAGMADKPNSVKVKITFDASALDTGSYRGIVALDGPGVGARVVDVAAEVVDHGVHVVFADGKGALPETVEFGPLFFGQKQVVRAVVVNNGPRPVTFQLMAGSAALHAIDDEGLNDDTGSSVRGGAGGLGRGGGGGGHSTGRGTLSTGRSGSTGGGSSVAGGGDDPFSPTGDPLLDAAFEQDFRIAPTQGTLEPYAEMPITISYTATDRRPAPLFRAQVMREQEEKLRTSAGLPPAAPPKMPGLGKYPQRRSPGPSRGGHGDEGGEAGGSSPTRGRGVSSAESAGPSSPPARGRSLGAGATSAQSRNGARSPLPLPSARSLSPQTHRGAGGSTLSAAEIAALYSRAPPAVEVVGSRVALIIPELRRTEGFTVLGRAVRPQVHLSLTHVDFGAVSVNGRGDATFTVRNESELLPVTWHLEKCTNYHATPDRGALAPLEEATVALSFIPSRLGPVNEAMPLIVRPGNGIPLQAPSKYVIRAPKGEPPQIGAKNARVAAAAEDPANMLVVPIALTALSIAPAPPALPGHIHVGVDGGYTLAASKGGIGVGLATQMSPPGHRLHTGGIIGGGVALTLGDPGGKPVPPGTVGPTGSVDSSVLTPFDGAAGNSGTAAIHALSNVTGPNAMGTVFRRSGVLAERRADLPLEVLLPIPEPVDQSERAHTQAQIVAAGGSALIISDTNAVEVAEERDRALVRARSSAAAAAAGAPAIRVRAPAWLDVATQRGLHPDEHPTDAAYSFTVAEAQARHEHVQRYNEYVKEHVDKRRRAKALALLARRGGASAKWDDPVSAGMDDGKLGLREPTLHLPDASREPLWLARPKGPDGRPMIREGGQGAATKKINPDKLVRTKFKPFPTTAAEKVDCAALLSDEELAAVVCGPATVAFGALNVRETGQKNFGVFNGLTQPVLVQLQLPPEARELALTGPLSQVVPPGQLAGFDVTFFAEEEQEFRSGITYVINGKHASRASVQATALPIEVLLSRHDVELAFAEDSLDTYVTEAFKMTNPGKADAEFVWRMRDPDAPFEVEPASGTLYPGETSTALVTYRPAFKCVTETVLTLAVRGGRSGAEAPTVILTGEPIDARVSVSEKRCDFGRVAVGLRVQQTVTLRNSGASSTVVYVSESLPKYVTAHPMIARIEPMDSVELTLTLEAKRPIILDPTQAGVSITVRGGKGIFLSVAGIAIIPEVYLAEPEVAFGGVTVGTKGTRRLTLCNRSAVFAEVAVDMTRHPRFKLRVPRVSRGGAKGGEGGDDEDDQQSIGEMSMFRFDEDEEEEEGREAGGKGLNTSGSSSGSGARSAAAAAGGHASATEEKKGEGEDGAVGSGGESDDEDDDDEEDEDENDGDADGRKLPAKFRVRLAPESSLPFDMVFAPKQEGPVSFSLPVTATGIVDLPGLHRTVSGNGLHPRIKVESLLVDFEERTWQSNPERRLPYTLRFRIYNTDSADVAWRADTSNLTPYFPEGAKPAFTFTPDSGIVPFGDSLEVEVNFTPHDPREYVNTVPIYLEGDGASDNDGAAYFEMELRGRGVPPSLIFDRREVILPAVPLGATATATFFIINRGYDHAQLKFRVPSNEITTAVSVPLRVTFPDGDTVSISQTRLPVTVELKAEKSLAFTSLIEFIAAENERYAIPISGIADNSTLTCYDYLDSHRHELFLEAPPEAAPALVASARPTDGMGGGAGGGGGGAGASKKGGAFPGKPDAPFAPAFPSKDTLSKAAGMVPAPGSSLPGLPVAVAPDSASLAPPVSGTRKPATASGAGGELAGGIASHIPHPPLAGSHLPSAAANNYSGLVKWLNTCALRTPIHAWPEDVIKANGKPILDMVEALSGTTLPARIRGKVPSGKRERAVALYRQAAELLNFLKVSGGFVHAVRAENLLPLEDFAFVRHHMHRGWFGAAFGAPEKEVHKTSEKKAHEKAVRETHPALSLAAWSTVTLQAIRVFSLSRVTVRAMVNTAGLFMDAESQKGWDELTRREAELHAKLAAVKAAASGQRGVQIQERPSVGATVKRTPRAGGSTTERSGPGGGGGGVDGGNSLMADFNGPKPSARVEQSIASLADATGGLVPSLALPATARSGADAGMPPTGRSGATSKTGATTGTSGAASGTTSVVIGGASPAEITDPKLVDAALHAEQVALKKAFADFLAPDGALSGSNVLSIPELLLLRWLGYHHNRTSLPSARRRVVDFGADLSDGSVLVHVLLSHAPELGRPGRVLDLFSGAVHAHPQTPKQQRENAVAVVAALKELGLTPPFAPEDLCPSAFVAEEHDPASEAAAAAALGGTGASVASFGAGGAQSLLDAQMAMLQASIAGVTGVPAPSAAADGKKGGAGKSDDEGATKGGRRSGAASASTTTGAGKKGPSSAALASAAAHEAAEKAKRDAATAAGEKIKPSRPLFTPVTAPELANRFPGTQRVRLGAAHARDWVLWAQWLWTHLPQQVPRTCIDFKGPLCAKIHKNVVLTNPTKKPIVYHVDIVGADCFGATGGSGTDHADRERTVRLEANSSLSFGVTCEAKFSRPMHGKLVFRSRGEATAASSVLIFALRSIVTSRAPLVLRSVAAPLYTASRVDIDVRNPSSRDADFLVTVLHSDPASKPGTNITPEMLAKLAVENPSEYAIGPDGVLPYYLREGYVPAQKSVDDVAARLSAMDKEDLALYGLTGEDAAALLSEGNGETSSTADNSRAASAVGGGGSVGGGIPPLPLGGHRGSVVGSASVAGSISAESGGASVFGDGTGLELPPHLARAVGRGTPHSLPDPFWCKTTTIRLKAGQTKKVGVQFLPFKHGPSRATIVVVDAKHEIGEFVYEINGAAESPIPHSQKLAARASVAKTVERLLLVPALNSAKEHAFDATIERLDRRLRQGELSVRETTRAEEAALRERAVLGLRKQAMGGGKHLAAAQKQAIKTAASIMLGTFYDVTVDSPFFDAPKRIYVPFPGSALPGHGAAGEGHVPGLASKGAGSEHGGSHHGGTHGSVHGGGHSGGHGGGASGGGHRRASNGMASLLAGLQPEQAGRGVTIGPTPSLIALTEPALETPAGPIAAFASTMSVGDAPPSQASLEIPSDQASAYRPLAAPAAIADALAAGRTDMLQALSRVPLICRPKGAGVYATRVTLKSDRDMRVFEVELTVEAPLPIRQVSFSTPVDKPLTQALPVSNPSSRDVVFNVSLAPVRKNIDVSQLHFATETSIRVRAGTTAELPVTFSPENVGDELATLTLTESGAPAPVAAPAPVQSAVAGGRAANAPAAAPAAAPAPPAGPPELPLRVVFDLRGVADEPLALDTLTLEVGVRGECTRTVTLFNFDPSGPAAVQMETDLPFIHGPMSVTVPAATVSSSGAVVPGRVAYTFTFCPARAGRYVGQLLFTDPRTGKYQWYAIDATCDSATPSARVAVSTTVRRAVAVEIDLSNPTDLEVALEVNLNGEGLVGDPVFVLGPGESRAYELLYAPLFPTPGWDAPGGPEPLEGLVTFTAPSVGDLTYGIDLVASPASPIALPLITAPVGSTATVYATLENPTAHEAVVRASVSNGRNFGVDTAGLSAVPGALSASGHIVVPAFGARKVPLTYAPSTLGGGAGAGAAEEETCSVHFVSREIGEWTYHLRGSGTAPVPAPVQTVLATVGSTVSASIPFRNPFPAPISILVDLNVEQTGMTASRILPREMTGAGEDLEVPLLALLRPTMGKNGAPHAIQLPPFGSTTVPFTFSPGAISETRATLRVVGQVTLAVPGAGLGSASRQPPTRRVELAWTFPVRAVGEAPASKKLITLKAPARTAAVVPISLPLAGWTPPPPSPVASPAGGTRRGSVQFNPYHAHPQQHNSAQAQQARSAGTDFTVEIVPVVGDEDIARLTAGMSVAAGSTAAAAGAGRSHTAGGGGAGARPSVSAGGAGAAAGAAADDGLSAARAAALAKLTAELQRTVTILPVRTTLTRAGEEIQVEARIHGLKPLDCRAELVVSRASSGGGAWRFPVRVSVPTAAPDDVLHISSPLNTPSTIVFGLANQFPRPAQFRASFTLDSPGEFRVSPATGTLPSSTAALYATGTGLEDGMEGYGGGSAPVDTKAEISITFTPREYGHRYTGTLRIETDEMLWTFAVVGTLPTYKPPTAGHATVDDHMSRAALATLRASQQANQNRNVVGEYLHTYLPPNESAAGVLVPVVGRADLQPGGAAHAASPDKHGLHVALSAAAAAAQSYGFGPGHNDQWMMAGSAPAAPLPAGAHHQHQADHHLRPVSLDHRRVAHGPGVPPVSPLRLPRGR
jgi:hypothetical protein